MSIEGRRFSSGEACAENKRCSELTDGSSAAAHAERNNPSCSKLSNAVIASTGTLALNHGGDSITTDGDFALGAASPSAAVTLDPDLTGAVGLHSGAQGSIGDLSAGYRSSGKPF